MSTTNFVPIEDAQHISRQL